MNIQEIEEQNYKQALDYLFSRLPMFSRTGAPAYKPGLQTSVSLDNLFGNPHKKFKSIHIAGTNGKGSTSHMMASVMQSMGFKTGLYTSPHLVDFRERMRINGKMIPKKKVVEFVEKWGKNNSGLKPSFFELTMIMAFDWFAKENVDVAVVETGMGGRLDSTNIISPELCIITNISEDHTQFLGSTLSEIAREKAGIIKKNTPVVIGETGEEAVKKVFEEKALAENAPLIFAEETEKDLEITEKENGWEICVDNKKIMIPLKGDYQQKNIKTVTASLRALNATSLKVNEDKIKEGLENVVANTGLSGRWTIINRQPLTIADTGHNIAGITYNVAQLEKLSEQGKRKLRMIIGFVSDKAIDKILDILPRNAVYYFTNASIPRALPVAELQKRALEHGLKGFSYDSVSGAYKKAIEDSAPDDIIFIGGSTFIVADFMATI